MTPLSALLILGTAVGVYLLWKRSEAQAPTPSLPPATAELKAGDTLLLDWSKGVPDWYLAGSGLTAQAVIRFSPVLASVVKTGPVQPGAEQRVAVTITDPRLGKRVVGEIGRNSVVQVNGVPPIHATAAL
jgi:hypothetical protein